MAKNTGTGSRSARATKTHTLSPNSTSRIWTTPSPSTGRFKNAKTDGGALNTPQDQRGSNPTEPSPRPTTD